MDENQNENVKDSNEEGAFGVSLKRNNKQIRDDRAQQIIDVAKLKYRRKIEDIEMIISDIQRERDNMLDLSPSTTQTLIVASDFNADEYIEKDIQLGIKIRNEEIRLELAKKSYKHLFGGNL